MTRKHLLLIAAVLLPTIGCSSTPDRGPDETADAIAQQLAAGKLDDANDAFENVEDSAEHRDAVYATVYERAGGFYRKDKYKQSADMMRFLCEQYPKADAPRVALLWTLFRERAASSKEPTSKQLKEWNGLVKKIRSDDEKNYSVFVDLASAQAAVDEGRLDRAQSEYARFKSRWNGKPREMRFYVEEFDRYFETKAEQS